ncbi:MAG: ATP-dependent DNA ligase [Candidatus Micrarchaeota archaeon]
MEFKKIAELFDGLEKTGSRLEMTSQLAVFFHELPFLEAAPFVYLLQGKLAPDYENVKIGMGEKFVEQAIGKVAGFSPVQVNKKFKENGDLGETAEYFVAQKKQQSFSSQVLSLKKVFDNMQKIAHAQGSGSQESKIRMLAELLNSASSLEARFIVRIPMEQLRLGVGDPTIMDALAVNEAENFKKENKKQVAQFESELKSKKEKERSEELELKIKRYVRELIEEKYNVHPDLGLVVQNVLERSLKGLKKIELRSGIPIRPTLAERLNSGEEIIEKLGKCAVETKLDGFRLQCHKDGEKVWIFSRQSENMTNSFPDLVKAIQEQIIPKQAIFEAEAIAFKEETGEFFSFQVTIQRKRKYGIAEKSEEFPLKLLCFDVVMVNNENLMEQPFLKRRKKLESIIKKGPILSLTEMIITDKASELNAFFEESISRGLEGIIAKDLAARYIAGARKFAWIKLKRSYKGELQDSADVVIIGYYSGKGKRTQFGLGGLLTAVYDKENDSFASIAKIGTGMTEQVLSELEEQLSKLKVKQKPKNVASELEPDFWVEPKIVIEVRADEITKSPIHCAGKTAGGEGFALRFPRMISFRIDRLPEDATTVSEIQSMYEKQGKVQLVEDAGETEG